MSYKEAVEDGVEFVANGKRGMRGYYPPCKYCGKPVYVWSYQRGLTYACFKCRNLHKNKSANTV